MLHSGTDARKDKEVVVSLILNDNALWQTLFNSFISAWKMEKSVGGTQPCFTPQLEWQRVRRYRATAQDGISRLVVEESHNGG